MVILVLIFFLRAGPGLHPDYNLGFGIKVQAQEGHKSTNLRFVFSA